MCELSDLLGAIPRSIILSYVAILWNVVGAI